MQQEIISTISANLQLPIVFSKGDLYQILFPGRAKYGTARLRSALFTDEVLKRIGLTPEEYRRRRVFSITECAAIRAILFELCETSSLWSCSCSWAICSHASTACGCACLANHSSNHDTTQTFTAHFRGGRRRHTRRCAVYRARGSNTLPWEKQRLPASPYRRTSAMRRDRCGTWAGGWRRTNPPKAGARGKRNLYWHLKMDA